MICIYHANCADGFTAAWVVRKRYGNSVIFHPGVYGEPPPDTTGHAVVIVDFSYKRPVMEELVRRQVGSGCALVIIDHHKTAQADLEGLEGAGVHFDMNKSGAGLTWDVLFPDEPRPKLINHIEDRDLWRFKLPMTREIQACVFSYEYTFDNWDRLMATEPELLAGEGAAIERKHFKDINELLAVCQRKMFIGGYGVRCASLPYTLTSDAGHALAKMGGPFGVCYWDTETHRVFSLRSTEESDFDVSKIAAMYGGGGHKHAAGFRVPRSHELATG